MAKYDRPVRAAVLHAHGETPAVEDFDLPARESGQALVEVLAAPLNPVDLAIAAGTFHGGGPKPPYVVGREGVGRVLEGDGLEQGARVYFDSPVAPVGSMAERTVIRETGAIEVPDGADDALAGCFGIAGLAAWLPLEWRAQLEAGEKVLVLGASGPVGQIAVQAARLLGAGRIVAAARSPAGLARAGELGAHEAVRIEAVDDLYEALRLAAGDGGFDVIVDPLWGEPAAAATRAAADGARLVQVGQSAGAEATIASRDVRGKKMSILGHTNGAAPYEVRAAAYRRMVEHALAGELECDLERLPLEQAGEAWARQREHPHRKLVLTP